MSIVGKLSGWLWRRTAPNVGAAASVIAGESLDDSPVVRRVAERLRQQELAHGGWAAEAGALPAEAYLPEARRLVRSIAFGDPASGPPTP